MAQTENMSTITEGTALDTRLAVWVTPLRSCSRSPGLLLPDLLSQALAATPLHPYLNGHHRARLC
jgi:hypothetical protein